MNRSWLRIITSYTFEGDPIFYNLDYDGQQIRYQFDNTHDNYGTPIKQVDFCKAIDSERTERGTVYKLTGCGENNSKESNTFSLLFPEVDMTSYSESGNDMGEIYGLALDPTT